MGFRFRLCAWPLLLAAAPAFAQVEDEQLWLQANTNVPVAPKLRLTLEQIARFGDRPDGLFQTEFGGILGYRLSEHVEVGFGYRWVGAHNGNRGANENRVRQHVIVTYGPWVLRSRIDERFNPRGDEVGIRLRQAIRYNHRIGGKGFALFGSHESFYLPNSTSWGQRRGYERMRNLVGVVVPLGKGTNADVGYLNQYRIGRGGAAAQMDHALSVQLNWTLGSRPRG